MDTQNIRLAKELFEAAADMPASERDAFLKARCGESRTLLSFVTKMLDDEDAPATGLLDKPLMNGAAVAALATPALPAWLGNYQLIRVLGEGGMAVVYEARQQNPSRTVALKVVRPGVLAGELLRRFQHEIEVLGRLQHPGIAHIYEAAVAEFSAPGGPTVRQPYFAMELIRGEPLTVFAEKHVLTDGERLELVAMVCDAVEYAHQRGVIHRDLKPANILVEETTTEIERRRDEDTKSRGSSSSLRVPASTLPFRPKVLDFGVARVAGPGGASMNTEAGRLIGTLAYMSPEQVGGKVEETDTRSDVYSLGVILYELLAERLPHDLRDLPLTDALRRIREEDPGRLRTVNRRFRGDVDIIVARAMEKDRTRRYQSASALAADIRRHLAGEAIEARRDSAVYMLRKTVRRHRGLAVAAVLAVAGLVAFAGYALVQADRFENLSQEEHQSRVDAEEAQMVAKAKELLAAEQAGKARMVSDFLKGVIELASRGPGKGPDRTLTDVLDEATQRLENGALSQDPAVEAELRATLASSYTSLELMDATVVHREWLLRYARDNDGPRSPAYLSALNALGRACVEAGRQPEAQRRLHEALELCIALNGRESTSTFDIMNTLGNSLMRENKGEEALTYSLPAAEGLGRVLGAKNGRACQAFWNLSAVYRALGRQDDVREMYRRAMPAFTLSDQSATVTTIRFQAGYAMDVLRKDGKLEEAEQHLRGVLPYAVRALGADHPETLGIQRNTAVVLMDRGEFQQARALLEPALETCRSVRRWVLPSEGAIAQELARCLLGLGLPDDARATLRTSLERFEHAKGPADERALNLLSALARLEQEQHNAETAAAILDDVAARIGKAHGEDDPRVAQWRQRAAKVRSGQ